MRNGKDEGLTGIDMNRGAVIKKHPGTGAYVVSYIDAPGAYMDASGKPLSEQVAREAGFPVEDDKSRARRAQQVERAVARAREALPQDEPEVIAQRGRYRVVSHGLGQFSVLRDEGEPVTPLRLTQKEAIRLLAILTDKKQAPRV